MRYTNISTQHKRSDFCRCPFFLFTLMFFSASTMSALTAFAHYLLAITTAAATAACNTAAAVVRSVAVALLEIFLEIIVQPIIDPINLLCAAVSLCLMTPLIILCAVNCDDVWMLASVAYTVLLPVFVFLTLVIALNCERPPRLSPCKSKRNQQKSRPSTNKRSV